MLVANQFDGASHFAGGSFMSTQATQAPDGLSFPAKTRGNQRVLPLTVKQIGEAYHSSDDKSNLVVDGVAATNVRLLGLVMNKVERPTDVSFTIEDGTGSINICRWVNETSDADEVAAIEDGMYIIVTCHLKGFQTKGLAFAYNIRLVTDFNDIVLHFIECMYVHLENNRNKVNGFHAKSHTHPTIGTPFPYGDKSYQVLLPNQFAGHSVMDASRNDMYNLVLRVFLEPAALSRENGLHLNEIVRRLGMPHNKIMDAINYHVDVGNIYTTVDEYHFKAAFNS